MMKLPAYTCLACLAAALAACSSSGKAAMPDAATPPVHVTTVAVTEREVPKTVLLAGTLIANQESDLAANASGRVVRTMVERGTFVARNAPIAKLDARMSTLSADEAQANLATAREQKTLADAECARNDRLFKKGIITQQELDKVSSACKTSAEAAAAASSRAAQALQMLTDATIRAPFAGLVAERYVSVGEYVRPETKVARIVDIDPLRLQLTISGVDIAAVKPGLAVQFQVAAYPGRSFSGTVRYIGPALRAATRDLVFEAVVENHDHLLRPGLFATAHLQVGTQKLPVVPENALRHDGDIWRAFVVKDKHLEERVVQTGPTEGTEIGILAGLTAGERIVAAPTAQLSDGTAVD